MLSFFGFMILHFLISVIVCRIELQFTWFYLRDFFCLLFTRVLNSLFTEKYSLCRVRSFYGSHCCYPAAQTRFCFLRTVVFPRRQTLSFFAWSVENETG